MLVVPSILEVAKYLLSTGVFMRKSVFLIGALSKKMILFSSKKYMCLAFGPLLLPRISLLFGT